MISTFVLNSSSSISDVYNYGSTEISIPSKGKYRSDFFNVDSFSFLRFYINFSTFNLERDNTDIEVYLKYTEEGLVSTALARGLLVKVPMINGLVSMDVAAELAMLTDGDVPIYDSSVQIIIVNNKAVPHIVRNVTVTKIK